MNVYIYIYNKYVDIYLCICENLTRKMWASFFFGEWLYESSAMAFPSGDRASKWPPCKCKFKTHNPGFH